MLGKILKKTVGGLGKMVSGISDIAGRGLAGVRKVGDVIESVPVLGGVLKTAYESTPLAPVLKTGLKTGEQIARLGQQTGSVLQSVNKPSQLSRIKPLVQQGQQIYRGVQQQKPMIQEQMRLMR